MPRPSKPAASNAPSKGSAEARARSTAPASAAARTKRAGSRSAPPAANAEPDLDLDGPLPRVLVAHPHVRCDVHVLGGSPHVVDSRVPVRRLWAWHRGGASVETLFKRYPALGQAKVLDALAFAYDNQELVDTDLAREQALFARHGHPSVGARPLSQLALPFDGDEG